jgi:hypothetical protein
LSYGLRESFYATVIFFDETVIIYDAPPKDNDGAGKHYNRLVVILDASVISFDGSVVDYYGSAIIYDDAVGVVGRPIDDQRQITNAECQKESVLRLLPVVFPVCFSVSGLGICENREAQNQPCDGW